MITKLGILWGILFLLGGILGFIPGFTTNEMFLGLFMVNAPHGFLHIFSGVIFLITSMLGSGATRLWFRIFGAFYAAMAVMGFRVGDGLILGLIANNQCDAWGHAVLAIVLLAIGFLPQKPLASV